jgi:hypothetical protein
VHRPRILFELRESVKLGRALIVLLREIDLITPQSRWQSIPALQKTSIVRRKDQLRSSIRRRIIHSANETVKQPRMKARTELIR